MGKKWLICGAAAGALCILAGYYAFQGGHEPAPFHDYRVMSHSDYTGLIDGSDPAVKEKSRALRRPEEAYRFVRDRVAYAPFLAATNPGQTLAAREGSCLAKAALLASLYRAMGIQPENVRIVVGIVSTPNGIAEHSWVDVELSGRCYQQDPSLFLGKFEFDQFPGAAFSEEYAMKESFIFNDEEFAVISQLNRAKNASAMSGH